MRIIRVNNKTHLTLKCADKNTSFFKHQETLYFDVVAKINYLQLPRFESQAAIFRKFLRLFEYLWKSNLFKFFFIFQTQKRLFQDFRSIFWTMNQWSDFSLHICIRLVKTEGRFFLLHNVIDDTNKITNKSFWLSLQKNYNKSWSPLKCL